MNPRKHVGGFFERATFLTVVLITLSLAARAAPVTLNLKDAEISALVESISTLTGKNFIIDPRVKGRVTVVSSKPMDDQELYQVFLAVLAVHGFAAVPSGKVVKIIPAAGAKQDSIPTIDRSGQVTDQIVTRVIQVQNVAAAQVVPILRPLIPPQGHLAAYTPTNVLIISDTSSNVERISGIIARIDLASNEEVEIIPLRHAMATEVVRVLSTLEQGKSRADGAPAAAGAPRLVADERTNSILLSGDKASRLRLRALIGHMDTPVESTGNTQVIYLRYAKAKDLATVLQGVSKKISAEAGQNMPSASGSSNPKEGNAPGSNTPTPTSSNNDDLVNIQADESTNALVITAPQELMRSLRTVIAQLDIRRAQVLVEAVIAEISTEKASELGVQWVGGGGSNGWVGFTNFNVGTNSSMANVLDIASGSTRSSTTTTDGNSSSSSTVSIDAGSLPTGFNALLGDLTGKRRFGALISALAKDADTNVLSTPTVVTLDNEEAEIIIGQNVPFVTGSYTTSSSSSTSSNSSTSSSLSNPFQTIQREDVGIKLKVKPQVNEGNAVKLEIAQEVSSVVPTANSASQGPTTNKRSIKTSVLVENGQILVLGGLIDDSVNQSAQKVPVLGDVPLLGRLFRYENTSKLKRNLMVFLHPVILRDAGQGTLYTQDKYSYIRDQQMAARAHGDPLLPDAQPPLLKSSDAVKAEGTALPMTLSAPPTEAESSDTMPEEPAPPTPSPFIENMPSAGDR